jgi:hypothetical protein
VRVGDGVTVAVAVWVGVSVKVGGKSVGGRVGAGSPGARKVAQARSASINAIAPNSQPH